jgi:hypothetical protein
MSRTSPAYVVRLGFLAAVPIAVGAMASLSKAQTLNPANGHYYLGVAAPDGTTWDQARAAAEAMTFNEWAGHLATIPTQAEMDFFLANTPTLGESMNLSFLLGGYRTSDGSDPAAGWRWITGAPWTSANWSTNEPNNLGGQERVLQFWTWDGVLGRWNDTPGDALEAGFVVEFGPPNANCRADWDGDGHVVPLDVAVFVNDWFQSLAAGGSRAGDFDFSGTIEPVDLAVFINTWFDNLRQGC